MNTSVKLLEAMINNPHNWKISQLQTMAKKHGINWRHTGGSHCVFIRSDGRTLPVPVHRPIKPIYIKKFIVFVKGGKE